jgi:hypothetical protein
MCVTRVVQVEQVTRPRTRGGLCHRNSAPSGPGFASFIGLWRKGGLPLDEESQGEHRSASKPPEDGTGDLHPGSVPFNPGREGTSHVWWFCRRRIRPSAIGQAQR